MATLEDLEDLLGSMNKSISEQTGFLKRLFELQNQNAEDERRRRERERADRSRVKPTTQSPGGAGVDADELKQGTAAGESFIGAFLGSAGILASIRGLAAGAASLSLALTGFTGWERNIIEKIGGGISSLSKTVTSGVVKLRNSILTKFFGFAAEGSVIRDPLTGRFASAGTVSEQIAKRVNNLRVKALSVFGLGADGKPIQVRGADGMFKGISIVGRATNAIKNILSPLKTVAEGVSGFIKGAGRGIWNFISPFIGKVGAFSRLVGTILKPIGIIFSAWSGIKEYMGKEGTIFEKFGAGISTFVADFVGVPFDLIKNGMLWIVKKFFPGLTTTDGSFDESTVMGRILQLASDFSIAETIKYLVEAPFKIITNIGDWITEKLSWDNITKPVFDLGKTVSDWASDVNNWFFETLDSAENTIKDKFDSIKNQIISLPDKARLIAEDMFNDTKEKLKIGFLSLGEWIASIPGRIKLMAFEAINFATSGLPEWAQIISDEDISKAKREVESGNPTIQSKISNISAEAQAERSRIARELQLLESASMSGRPSVNIIAPNNSTTQNNIQGGSSSSTLNSFGRSNSNDIDRMTIPGGVQ